MYLRLIVFNLFVLGFLMPSFAQVAQHTSRQSWESAVNGNFSTIDFTDFPDGTMITNQYQSNGLVFSGWAQIWQTGIFVNDGWGIWGTNGLRISFIIPQNWVAVDYPGAIRFNLYRQGVLFFTSTYFQPGGTGRFAGVVSTMPFDEVYLDRGPPGPNYASIDDLHWGAPVPAPSALGLLGVAVLSNRSRRRRE